MANSCTNQPFYATVATKKDSFVVANYYRNSTSAGSAVKLFDANSPIATLAKAIKLQQNTIPSVSSAWELREIQYDYQSGMTFVLQDMDYPINAPLKVPCVNTIYGRHPQMDGSLYLDILYMAWGVGPVLDSRLWETPQVN